MKGNWIVGFGIWVGGTVLFAAAPLTTDKSCLVIAQHHAALTPHLLEPFRRNGHRIQRINPDKPIRAILISRTSPKTRSSATYLELIRHLKPAIILEEAADIYSYRTPRKQSPGSWGIRFQNKNFRPVSDDLSPKGLGKLVQVANELGIPIAGTTTPEMDHQVTLTKGTEARRLLRQTHVVELIAYHSLGETKPIVVLGSNVFFDEWVRQNRARPRLGVLRIRETPNN